MNPVKNALNNLINPEDLKIKPLELAETYPAQWVTDSHFHTFDLDTLIRNSWQYAGHISQIKNKGDYFIVDIAARSIIVVRESEDSCKALYNICKHRGGPLVSQNGNTSRFKCMYHGWTYDLNGELRGVPEFDGVQDFKKCDFGLISLELQIWQGLIFIHMGNPDKSLAQLLEGIDKRIAPIELTHLNIATQTIDKIKCNWKIYVENYLEGYHLPQVHPGLSQLLDYKSYHTELFENYSLQYSLFKNTENIYSDSEGEAYYYFIFPNTMLNILPGRLQVNRINPVNSNKCDVHFDYLYADPQSEEGKKFLEEDKEYSDGIQEEDIFICEQVQKNLESGIYKKGRFSVKRESGVHDFQSHLKEAYKNNLDL